MVTNQHLVAVLLLLYAALSVKGTAYHNVGCFRDIANNRAMGNKPYLNLRDRSGSLWENWPNMSQIIEQCAQGAEALGYDFFGVQFYGECWGSNDAASSYGMHGKSNNCENGVGKKLANRVYMVLREDQLNHVEVCENMVGPNTNMSAGFSGTIIDKTNALKVLCDDYKRKLADAEDPSVLDEDLLDVYDDINAELYCLGTKAMDPDTNCDSTVSDEVDTAQLVENVKEMDKALGEMAEGCEKYDENVQQSSSTPNVGNALSAAEALNKCFCQEKKKWCGREMRNVSKSSSDDMANLFHEMNANVVNPFPTTVPSDDNASGRAKLPLSVASFGKVFGCDIGIDLVTNCYGVTCTYPKFGPAINFGGSFCFPAELNVELAFCVPPISDYIGYISALPHVGKLLSKIGLSGGCLLLGDASIDLARSVGSFTIGPKLDLFLVTIKAQMSGFIRFGAPNLPLPNLQPCSRMEFDKSENGQNHLKIAIDLSVAIRVPWIKWCWAWWVPYPCGGGMTEKVLASFKRSFTHRLPYKSNSHPSCNCCRMWPNWAVDYRTSDMTCAVFC